MKNKKLNNVWMLVWFLALLIGLYTPSNAQNNIRFPSVSAPMQITNGPEDHLFASYYGINSWSKSQRYATVLQTSLKDSIPNGNVAATLGLVDMDNHDFIPLAETRAWNFQEGCMAHWLGYSPDSLIIYNDILDGKTVSIILNVHTKEKVRVLPHPVSAVSPDGKYAVSINYSRISLTRPDYGYGIVGQDLRADDMYPKDDGLFLMNLRTGQTKLLVSMEDIKNLVPEIKHGDGLEYFCHTLFSRDGTKIFWLARAIPERNTTAFTVDLEGENLRRCFPDGWDGSHYDWLDGDRLMVTAKFNATEYSHVLFTIGETDYQRIGNGVIDFDGHGTFSPNGKWMITDSYPSDGLNEQRLLLMDLKSNAVLPLGRFRHDLSYESPDRWTRCDLHCRWSPNGDMIGFNSTHSGSRQVYVLKLNE